LIEIQGEEPIRVDMLIKEGGEGAPVCLRELL
jgi:hypothetical protein